MAQFKHAVMSGGLLHGVWVAILLGLAFPFGCAESFEPQVAVVRSIGGTTGSEADAGTSRGGSAGMGDDEPFVTAGRGGGACEPPEDCVEAECGNGILEDSAEECDDSNTEGNDGCSDSCQLEAGWSCSVVGAACRAAECGDGIIAGWEECDNGAANGTGMPQNEIICDERCRYAMDPAKCGNGMLDPGEPCDDGNYDMGDGCGILCEPEPQCPPGGGACPTACGDGLLLQIDAAVGQECDDGNNINGDGCSAECKVEAGFVCEEVTTTPDELVLPIVYRDFRARQAQCAVLSVAECLGTAGCHPDFGRFGSSCRTPGGGEAGIAEARLGADGKPVHVAAQRVTTVNNDPAAAGTDFFDLWYRDNADYNMTVADTLAFTRQNGVFQFTANPFFPLDARGFGNGPCYNTGGTEIACPAELDHNFYFTSEVRYWFEYRGGEQLEFFGDDDVWVYVNKQLAVDLGGVHGQEIGSVTLDPANGTGQVCDLLSACPTTPRQVDLGLQLGSVYEIVVFQAERNKSESNYQLTLSNFEERKSECQSICGDGIVTPDEACDDGVNDGSYGTCNPDCSRAPFCGDGKLDDPPEECDDGNNQNGDRCSARCRDEDIK